MLRDLNRKFIPIRIYQLIFNNENFLPSKNKEFYINFICGLHIFHYGVQAIFSSNEF
jgi:hypothetical protein